MLVIEVADTADHIHTILVAKHAGNGVTGISRERYCATVIQNSNDLANESWLRVIWV